MWLSRTNEHGAPLTLPECEALIERHSELFGTWPLYAPLGISGVTARILAQLDLADRHVAKGKQRVADQRSRVAGNESVGGDTMLSRRLLVSFEMALRLMIAYRDLLAKELAGIAQTDAHSTNGSHSADRATEQHPRKGLTIFAISAPVDRECGREERLPKTRA